ncbi:unnamed protein product, partial [Linum tenue]
KPKPPSQYKIPSTSRNKILGGPFASCSYTLFLHLVSQLVSISRHIKGKKGAVEERWEEVIHHRHPQSCLCGFCWLAPWSWKLVHYQLAQFLEQAPWL